MRRRLGLPVPLLRVGVLGPSVHCMRPCCARGAWCWRARVERHMPFNTPARVPQLLVSGLCDGPYDRDAFLHHCCSARGAAQLLASAAGAGAAAAGEAEQAAGRLAAVSEAGGGGTAAQLQQVRAR